MVIQVLNFHDGATIDYPLAFVKALLIPPCSCAAIEASNLSSGASQSWAPNAAVLKCFVRLQPGANRVRLHCRHNEVELLLRFAPSSRRHRVRLLYLTARHSDGAFQAPPGFDCGPEAAKRRIRTAALLLQSLTAELLAEAGLGRRTFQLVTDSDLEPTVDCFECSFGMEEALQLSSQELWPRVARDLAAAFAEEMDTVKWLGFMAFTRYSCEHSPLPKNHQEVMERTRGHCALGGGGLALFGTGNFYTWADSLDTVPDRFGDARRVDRRHFMDDSAFRGSFWSNYATGLGAVLHELGHTFDLSHTAVGIMQRGGDDINLALAYPPSDAAPCEQCSGLRAPSTAFLPPNGDRGALHIAWQPAARYLQKDRAFVPLKTLQMKMAVAPQNGECCAVVDYATMMAPNGRCRDGIPNRAGPGTWSFCSSPFHNGQADFARSSAVLLAFHRWFRDDEDCGDFCLRISRTELLADRGLRIVEFVADGIVQDHWEYLGPKPPTIVPLGTSLLRQICPDVSHVVVIAEDDAGHIYKARVRIDQFGESPVLSPA